MAIRFSPFGNSALYLPNMEAAEGYKLYIYQAGTSTKVQVYADVIGTTQPNPVVLDASGWPSNAIYLSDERNYRFVYAHPLDQDPPVTQITPPIDNVALVAPPVQIVASEWVPGTVPTYISATQFSVTGNQTSIYHAGRRVKAEHSGGITYGSILSSTFSANTTVTIINDGPVLSSGMTAVSYGFLSAFNSSWPGGYSSGINTVINGTLQLDLTKEFSPLPAGTIIAYAGAIFPPPGWYLTDGALYSEATHPKLGDALSYTRLSNGLIKVPTIANLQANIRYIIRNA